MTPESPEQEAASPASFEELFLKHRERVYRAAYALLLDHSEAEDVAQETFLKAFDRWPSTAAPAQREAGSVFAGRSAPGTWLYRIAVNAAHDRLRRRVAERARLERAVSAQAPVTRPGLSLARDPSQLADHREQSHVLLQRSLETLSADQRAAFSLREVAGLSVNETAETLGCSAAKVRVDTHRARRHLRAIMGAASSQGEATP